MTKQDVFRQISGKTGLNSPTCRLIMEAFFEVVKESLTKGETVYIGTFGRFLLRRRAQKIGRNIHQNKAITIAAHMVPYFKPSPNFISQVREQIIAVEEKKVNS